MTSTPNRRVQDGIKLYWLCDGCETLLSISEGAFSSRIFHPLVRDSGRPVRYAEWMMHFCTSVSWRVLQYFMTEGTPESHSDAETDQMALADQAWREVLLGHRKHAGKHEQHFLPVDEIVSFSGSFAPNINRYLMRAVQMDLCAGRESLFTFAKLGRFIILGFVHEPTPRVWVGTKVHANEGTISPRNYTLPAGFGSYLNDKALQTAKSLSSMSDEQHNKVDGALRQNIEKFAESDLFRALRADVEMFGDDAFIPRLPSAREP